MQNLVQCKDTNITLPRLNDAEDNPFVQKTAIDLRRAELEKVEEVFTQLNEANFTMDKELEKLNGSITSYSTSTNSSNVNNSSSVVTIPNESLIVYVENETAPLPEIIIELLRGGGKGNYPAEEWYIYGVKNPESFYKSFLLLTRLDFIIKNKTEKKNDVATFKREMALHYEAFYKELDYRKLRLPHHDMIHKLTSMDNYCGYDALRFLCDFSRVNLVMLDIVERKYLDIPYTAHSLMTGVEDSITTTPCGEFIIIIKYANDTYLPLMNSNGKHIFKSNMLEYISRNYERVTIEKFKEPNATRNLDDGFEVTADNNLSGGGGGCGGEEDSSYENESLAETGNILDSKTVSVFFNNTIPIDNDTVDINPIIRAGEFSMAIEDMIEISEEHIPTSINVVKTETEKQHDNIAKMLSRSTTTETINVPVVEPVPATVANNVNLPVPAHVPTSVPVPAFDALMSMIPSKVKTETKVPKAKKTKETKELKEPKEPKATTANKITKKTSKAVELISPIMEPVASANVKTESSNDKLTSELKPVKEYSLLDLQMLARVNKVDTQKEGKTNKKVNKTKDELYNEIKSSLKKK